MTEPERIIEPTLEERIGIAMTMAYQVGWMDGRRFAGLIPTVRRATLAFRQDFPEVVASLARFEPLETLATRARELDEDGRAVG